MRLIDLDAIMAQFPKADFYGDATENMKAYPHWRTDITGLINILEAVPIVEQSEDCISRKEALECARLITDDEGIMHEVIHVDDIKDLPSVKPKAEPCNDTVSTKVVTDYIKGHIHEIISASGRDLNEHTNQVLRAVIKGVEVLPRK
jgi:hypothetical protein